MVICINNFCLVIIVFTHVFNKKYLNPSRARGWGYANGIVRGRKTSLYLHGATGMEELTREVALQLLIPESSGAPRVIDADGDGSSLGS